MVISRFSSLLGAASRKDVDTKEFFESRPYSPIYISGVASFLNLFCRNMLAFSCINQNSKTPINFSFSVIKRIFKNFLLIFTLITLSSQALALEVEISPKKMSWPFDGILGKVDRQAAQRGFQVYREVCSACHGLYNLSYRNLKDIGFSEAEIKEIARNYTIKDGPNDQGEMFERPALPIDKFVRPYLNEQAARAANNNAYPLDLSLIVKARHNGANYLYSLLTGYTEPPPGFKLTSGLYYNTYFSGHQIAMPPPLTEGQVTYSDGTQASIEQMARDVTIFLQWAAEPEMEHRKSMGLKVMIFLVIFTIFFYISKNRIWHDVK